MSKNEDILLGLKLVKIKKYLRSTMQQYNIMKPKNKIYKITIKMAMLQRSKFDAKNKLKPKLNAKKENYDRSVTKQTMTREMVIWGEQREWNLLKLKQYKIQLCYWAYTKQGKRWQQYNWWIKIIKLI